MIIRIDDKFIEKWHPKYDEIENDEKEYQNILKLVSNNIKNADTISKPIFIRILNWKAPRVKGIVELDKFDQYAEAIKRCANKSILEEEKLAILDDLRGIGVPVASTILHFMFPKTFPIMDVRTVEVLHCGGYIESDKRDQKRFVPFRNTILNIQHKYPRWSLREIDRALFAYHKINKININQKCKNKK